jgi:AraC-like DNA-binding protein
MKTELYFQSYHEELACFKRSTIKSEWDTLILVVDGAYGIHINDQSMVIKKNEIMFIPAGVKFDREVLSSVTYYNICFRREGEHPTYFEASQGIFKIPTNQVEALLESMRCVSILPDNRELIIHMIERIFMENYLFAKLNPFSEEVENTIQYMRRNLDKKIDMEELAKRVYLSHNGLIWKFKQELNTTPSKYLYLLRMRNAKRLLLNYSYSITEVSEQCGYQNPYYFSNEFHRYTGMSPSAFRKQYLNG